MGAASLAELPFREVWAVDFEFTAPPGERPSPVCLVATELKAGRKIRLWRDQFGPAPPYPLDANSLFVSFYASAELGCHRVLGWPMPARVLDLSPEFRRHVNGLLVPAGKSLIGALIYFGLEHIGAEEKTDMRDLVMRGGPWSESERAAILDYCESDVVALARLLPVMLPHIDLPRALLRGRYSGAAVSAMEYAGVPIEVPTLNQLRDRWTDIQDDLIAAIDADYGVYDGRTFNPDRFEAYLSRHGIPWPSYETGRLELNDDVFRDGARAHPILAPLRELRASLGTMKLNDLAVGSDGRNRYLISPFASKTSRNQPSSAKSVFGPATWIRSLIKPPPGYGVAYIDWCQQEFGIAAVLSGDANMLAAYETGDPYLAFAKQAGGVPPDATKKSHPLQRERFKHCVLGVQYGIGANTLAYRIGNQSNYHPLLMAKELLRAHRETYPDFWKWSDMVQDHAMLFGFLKTVFGWHVRVGEDPNPRSLRNFPMQANGAEMLRIACCLATEAGIEVCAPVHDAILICAPLDQLEDEAARMQVIMAEASAAVLSGFELRTDVSFTRYPDRYVDPRGKVMWDKVMDILSAPPRAKPPPPSIAPRPSTLNPTPFFYFCNERYSIYKKREAGLPQPWTEDPFLTKTPINKYCNVFREDDTTTKWFRANVRDPLSSSPAAAIATVIFRAYFNRISTGEIIFGGDPSPFNKFLATRDANVLLEALRPRWWATRGQQNDEEAIFGPAYRIFGTRAVLGPDGKPSKLDGVCDRLQKFIKRYDRAPLPPGLSLEAAWGFFRQFEGMVGGDGLIAYEIISDLRWTDFLRNAPDKMSWANAGPGAKKGLNLLHRRPVGARLPKGQSLAEMRELLELSRSPEWWSGPPMEMRDVEHSLCETGKYLRRKLCATEHKQRYGHPPVGRMGHGDQGQD